MARYARLAALVVAGALTASACGHEQSTTTGGRAPTVTSAAMTRDIPPRFRRVCASAARKGTVAPEGGVNGGHVVAIARAGDQLTYVSVHGHEHTDVAVAMLVDLLADR